MTVFTDCTTAQLFLTDQTSLEPQYPFNILLSLISTIAVNSLFWAEKLSRSKKESIFGGKILCIGRDIWQSFDWRFPPPTADSGTFERKLVWQSECNSYKGTQTEKPLLNIVGKFETGSHTPSQWINLKETNSISSSRVHLLRVTSFRGRDGDSAREPLKSTKEQKLHSFFCDIEGAKMALSTPRWGKNSVESCDISVNSPAPVNVDFHAQDHLCKHALVHFGNRIVSRQSLFHRSTRATRDVVAWFLEPECFAPNFIL